MIGLIGTYCGLEVYIAPHAGTTTRVSTRKQTRKFKNARWVKKYKKRHTKELFTPGIFQVHDAIFVHPSLEPEFNEMLKQSKDKNSWLRN